MEEKAINRETAVEDALTRRAAVVIYRFYERRGRRSSPTMGDFVDLIRTQGLFCKGPGIYNLWGTGPALRNAGKVFWEDVLPVLDSIGFAWRDHVVNAEKAEHAFGIEYALPIQ